MHHGFGPTCQTNTTRERRHKSMPPPPTGKMDVGHFQCRRQPPPIQLIPRNTNRTEPIKNTVATPTMPRNMIMGTLQEVPPNSSRTNDQKPTQTPWSMEPPKQPHMEHTLRPRHKYNLQSQHKPNNPQQHTPLGRIRQSPHPA